MRPNSRRYDEYAPHVRGPAPAPAPAPARASAGSTGSAPARRRGSRRKRTAPAATVQPQAAEVQTSAEVALDGDDSVAAGE